MDKDQNSGLSPFVYMRGDPTHGEEIIKTLKAHGGINTDDHNGVDNLFYYYISPQTRTIEKCLATSSSPVYEFLLKWYSLLTI